MPVNQDIAKLKLLWKVNQIYYNEQFNINIKRA